MRQPDAQYGHRKCFLQANYQNGSTCVLVQKGRNENPIIVVHTIPTAVLRLWNGEIDCWLTVLCPGLQLLDDLWRERATCIQHSSIRTKQEDDLS